MRNKFIAIFIIFLIIIFLAFNISCIPELKFGDLIICEKVNEKTYEPINPREAFTAEQERIFATIACNGAKGSDEFGFKWINTTTGETVLDMSSKYNEGSNRYLDGYIASSIDTTEEIKLIAPGKYEVEFFHNGEIKSKRYFIVKKPALKIIEVILTNKIDDYAAPINNSLEFGQGETIYACVKINYLISGNTILAKWYAPGGKLMLETPVSLEEDYYEENYIAFDFSGSENYLPAGKYKVEIYLNDTLDDSYEFNIIETGK